jgi:holo-[acyl-carrier protein] synthase
MKRQIENDAEFIAHLFTSKEISYCLGKRYLERHFAARFAAKEAFFKAISDGHRVEIPWHDIEVTNGESGRPILAVIGIASKIAEARKARNIFLTMAHSARYAMANVILES